MFRICAYDRDGRQVAVVDAAGGEITIGREADRRLVLPSPSVSRRHARIVLDGPQPYVEDQGSANGVLVNGVRIGGPTALVPGVRVDVAEFWLDFQRIGAQPAAAPPPMAPPAPQYQAAPQAPASPLKLRAQGGPFNGRVFDIPGGRVSIGRAIDNDLVFDDPSLSRKHAVVHTIGPDRIELQDLGSSNGTWVNGRKIDAGIASLGDAVRFGDLMFVLEGDAPAPQQRMPDFASQTAGGVPEPRRNNTALYAGIGVGVLVIAAAVTFLVLKPGKGGGGGGGTGAGTEGSVAEQVEQKLKSGKDKLANKDFDGARADFERTLELDPTNGEARVLKMRAANEPANEKLARSINSKLGLTRADVEGLLKMLGQLPSDSMFHEPTAQKVTGKLVSFADSQCKVKKYVDCAWAICKAIETVPPAARATLITSATEAQMHDAEKKAAKEKGFTPCRKK